MTPERWQQITGIFHAALTRDAVERPAFVAGLCGDDSELQGEVESMLAAHVGAGAFGETPVFATPEAIGRAFAARPALDVGCHVGPYQIVSLIGAGGMGEVYRARDTRLHRDVAVKVLLPTVANDPERVARFAREARVLASLNHPHIAHIYGLEALNGVRALMMELVEGPALAHCISRGPLPLDEALRIAKQIAEALEAAHQHHIVHRDLKPANIKLRPDGTVKVLDFGLAKAVDQIVEFGTYSARFSTAGMTGAGVVMGTASYMAPEQAQGKPVDKRADIWAFGCVLFEMLTGRRAFDGDTSSHVFVAILEREPEWQLLPETTPTAIRRLLRRCLEKDPKRRLDSAAVARIEIDEAPREAAHTVQAAPRRVWSWRPMAWATVGAGVAVLVVMLLAGRTPLEPPWPVVIPIRVADLALAQPGVHFAVTPSGRTVVYAGNYGGTRVLYRRDLDRVDSEPIPGTQIASDVFFSPDGRSLGFESRSELWTASFDGATTPQRLLPNQPLRGGTWSEDDTIVVGRVGSGLWLASANGGEPRQLTIPEPGERHELPQMLPGGRAVLFTILASAKPPRVAVHLLGSGETRSLFEGAVARFIRSGHIVYGRQGRLWAVGFDPTSLKTVGTARLVRDDILWSATGYPQFAVGGGTLAYVRANEESSGVGKSALTWIDRQGRRDAVPLQPNNFLLFRLSPAGDRVVIQVAPSGDLWIFDFTRGTWTRLTSDRIIAYSSPTWTPDGNRVAFTTWFGRDVGLGVVRADGSGELEELVKGMGLRSFERADPVLLADGSGAILTGLAPGATVQDLLFLRLIGQKGLETLIQGAGVERNPALAPNGRFIAYNSDESSRSEVYVRPFPDVGSRKWQISTQGGLGPLWTRSGSEIVYEDGQGLVMSVAVRSDSHDAFEFAKPEPLFRIRRGSPESNRAMDRNFDVTADGERFLVSDPVVESTSAALELILIQNWIEELKAKVP